MTTPRVCVLRAPGTNCDVETAYAFDLAGAKADRVHLERLLEAPERLSDYQVLCIAGGFSFGDDIGAGVILSRHLQIGLGDAVRSFVESDRLVLGICNGFQVLLKSGLLPGGGGLWPPADNTKPQATLTWNDNGKYTARWVHLKTDKTPSVFLRNIEAMDMPIAHAEGRIAVTDEDVIPAWERNGQIALRYADRNGSGSGAELLPAPINPNGSIANIAALSDPSGRILGLMPHPERYLFGTQHPRWTRWETVPEHGEGLRLFQNAVDYFE